MFTGTCISYAMSRDSDLINWLTFFDRKKISSLEWVAARDLSVRWQTTAIADVSVYLPRYNQNKRNATGMPVCKELQILNNKFSQAIWNKDLKQAKIIYQHLIERGVEIAKQTANSVGFDEVVQVYLVLMQIH